MRRQEVLNKIQAILTKYVLSASLFIFHTVHALGYTVKALINARAFIRIVTFHIEGDGHL